MRACRFSAVRPSGRPPAVGGERVEVRLEDRLDRDDLVPVAERGGERRRVDEAAFGGIARRHGRREHAVAPERLDREARRERRIDAARQPEHRVGEAALARVVAQPEHERAPGGLLVRRARLAQERRRRRPRRLAGQRDVVHQEVLVEVGAAQHLRAVRRDADRVAVEHQLVVAADLIQIEEVPAVLHRLLSNQLPPDRRLLQRERAGGDVHEQVGSLVRQLAHRIAVVQAPRPEALVVPDVLADRHADPRRP